MKRKRMNLYLQGFVLLSQIGFMLTASADSSNVVGIMNFSTNDPAKWEEARRVSSEAAPLTLLDIQELIQAGLGEKALVEIIRGRKVLFKPSGKNLAELKKQGASDKVLSSLSTFALPENREIFLRLTLDIETPYTIKYAPHLYLALVHKGEAFQEDIITGPLGDIFQAKWGYDELVDNRDPMMPIKVRRIRITGPIKAVHHGMMEFRILLSKQSGIQDLTDMDRLDALEKAQMETISFEYPEVSRTQSCGLDIVLGRDPLLVRNFSLKHKRLRCFWD